MKPQERRAIGGDIFVESALSADALGKSLEQVDMDRPLRLKVFSNRGTKVYPPTGAIADCVDPWRSALSVVMPAAMSMAPGHK